MDFGYETQGILLFAALSIAPLVPPAILFAGWLRCKTPAWRTVLRRRFLIATLLAAAVYSIVCFDAFLFEPNHPVLNYKELSGDLASPLRILHLSDLHIETDFPKREAWLLETLAGLDPDLILITGDIHQTENTDPVSLGRVLGGITAPLGVFACVGYDTVSLIESAAPQITFLVNEATSVNHGSGTIGISGMMEVGRRQPMYDALSAADYGIVMNHTPDLADEAASEGVDLYLCGHTHGGQVRVPFWGALITNTDSGKKYEGGWYHVGATAIHTSRGLGLEPPPAPQVRFFCRPEITLITVLPE